MPSPPGGSVEADAVIRAFTADLQRRPGTEVEWTRGQHTADTGWWEYRLVVDGRRYRLGVPAVPVRQIRWTDDAPAADGWRVTVDGAPWPWPLALAACRD